MMRRTLAIMMIWVVCTLAAPFSAIAAAQPPASPPVAAQDEYVPIDEIPEHDKLPAAPFLIGAYTIVWLVLLFYVWTVWRRQAQVEEELKRLAAASTPPR